MQGVKAKKSLGQHFLTDKNIAQKIAESLSQDNCQSILEIGPGTGVLTSFLINSKLPFFAVEIDKESIDFLKKEFPGIEFIVEGDFLKVDLSAFPKPMNIIGNFPYYISSQILFRVLEHKNDVNEVVCMIQKEVAERIASPPGNKTYGILSVFLQAYFDIEYLFTVHEHCFSPAPKVKSAVIRLKRNSRQTLDCDEKLVKQTFNQRRKTMRNSLKPITQNLDSTLAILNKRPEQLSVDEFVELTNIVQQSVNQ
jgi:16S rRNA (adenine1518-N6/adenine1519-N6)-dimethyltransferase